MISRKRTAALLHLEDSPESLGSEFLRVPTNALRWQLASRAGSFSLQLLLLVACSSANAEPEVEHERATPPHARAARVETAIVANSRTDLDLRLPGEVEGSRDALLASALGGYVERVFVHEGDEVTEGQMLVQVDSALHGAHLAQARVEVEAAERELRRAEQLSGTIAERQLDDARSRVAAARAAQRSAQVPAGRARIRAPFAGTVAQVAVERGEVTAPGAPVVRLVQLDPVHVSLAVPDRDVVAISVGMAARIFVLASGRTREGRVLRVSPAADLQTRAFEVIVEMSNPEGDLLPGMIAQVEIVSESLGEQLVVPQFVLVTRRSGNGVFVAEEGVARWRAIEIGSVVRDQVVIESGLRAGDELIVTGHRELADGDPLLVARRGQCCTAGRVVHEESE